MMTVDDPMVLAEVTAAFDQYQAALLANDTAILIALFRDASETLRYGATENLYGADAIRAFRASRSGGVPPRRILRQVITTYGQDTAVTNIEYQPLGSERIGRQTQTWIRLPEGWRIVAAHVSWLADCN